MITYGLLILIIGIIVWAVGAVAPLPVLVIVGKAVGLIGAIVLVVGLLLLAIPSNGIQITSAFELVR